MHVGSHLSDTSRMLSIICQLLDADCRLSVKYLRQVGGYMSAIWGRMSVICQLHKRQDDVICQLHEAGWLLSVSYMWQVIGVSKLHETWWRLSVSYMRQVDCYLSVTWGRMTVICQLHEAGRRLSVSNIRGRITVTCQLHEACWLLSVSYMGQVGGYRSVTWDRMMLIC